VLRDPGAVRRQIGLTGQYASVDDTLTGRQNLVMIGRLLDLGRGAAKARARELLAWFGLEDAGDRPVRTYSGGMRRRLDLAASLVGRPAIVFLDEPTTGLDPTKRDDMWDVVRGLVRDGSTVLLTTQYLEEADELADDIVVIDRGRVIARDTPDGLKRLAGTQTITVRPADPGALPMVARIVGDATGAHATITARGTAQAPTRGDVALGLVVAALDAADITVTELSLHLPSLDEVFSVLTGGGASTPVFEEVAA
jgi:oleandomycin transport system ATP-binding protein